MQDLKHYLYFYTTADGRNACWPVRNARSREEADASVVNVPFVLDNLREVQILDAKTNPFI